MLELKEFPLSDRYKKSLAEHARYHGSLTQYRISIIIKSILVSACIIAFIVCIAVILLWIFSSISNVYNHLSSIKWGIVLSICIALIISLWDSAYSHKALNDRKVRAQNALSIGKEVQILITFDENCFSYNQDHGKYYFIDDGKSGTVIVSVSTISDDPCEKQALSEKVSAIWRLDVVYMATP